MDVSKHKSARSGVKTIQLRGPIFISEQSLKNLARFATKAPPAKCHLELTLGGEDPITIACRGSCPEGQACDAMDVVDKNGKLTITCECQE